MKTEKEVEDYLVAEAKRLGCLCEKLIRKEGRGWPDRTVIAPGGVVGFIELKKPDGGELSPQQIDTIRTLQALGAVVHVASNKTEVDNVLYILMNTELF